MAGWFVLLVSVVGGILVGFLKRPPLLVILGLNLVPVAGVLWAGWSPLQLLLLYWLENVAVGVFNALKLRDYEAHRPEVGSPFRLSNFFMMHYGLFTLVHGVFALVVGSLFAGPETPGGAWAGLDWLSFAAAALALAAIHFSDYLRWRAVAGWTEGSADAQMFAPYGRIIVMHLTVLGGAFILAASHAPVAYVALLALLKTFIETGWAMMGQKQMAGGASGLTMTINGRTWRPGKPPRDT